MFIMLGLVYRDGLFEFIVGFGFVGLLIVFVVFFWVVVIIINGMILNWYNKFIKFKKVFVIYRIEFVNFNYIIYVDIEFVNYVRNWF